MSVAMASVVSYAGGAMGGARTAGAAMAGAAMAAAGMAAGGMAAMFLTQANLASGTAFLFYSTGTAKHSAYVPALQKTLSVSQKKKLYFKNCTCSF